MKTCLVEDNFFELLSWRAQNNHLVGICNIEDTQALLHSVVNINLKEKDCGLITVMLSVLELVLMLANYTC